MKILYVTTVSETMPFFTSHIKMLLNEGHNVDMACNIKKPIEKELLDSGCNTYNINFSRSPFNISNISAIKKLKELIIENKYDVIHTHTPIASLCTRIACKNIKNIKVIYTAHGFHFFKGSPLQNWLIYYPIEKWLSKYTDVIITINEEDYNRAVKSFKSKTVKYMPGIGLDTTKINQIEINKKMKRNQLGIPNDAFVILSVGELNKNKNHESILRAIASLDLPDIFYVICGNGPLKDHLINIANELGIKDRVKLLGFRNDIIEICKIADIFAFPSFREGLGMAALEAMASGLPLISSNIHGINDYSLNSVTGFSCAPNKIECFAKNILMLKEDNQCRLAMGAHNIVAVKKYDINNSLKTLNEIYSETMKI